MDWKDQPEDPRAQKIIAQMEINSQADRDEIGMLRRLAGELAEIRCELRKTDARDTPITSVEMIRNLTRERDEARAEVGRLRAITSPGDAAAFEEHMAAREAHWVRRMARLEGLILAWSNGVNFGGDALDEEARRIRAQREEG